MRTRPHLDTGASRNRCVPPWITWSVTAYLTGKWATVSWQLQHNCEILIRFFGLLNFCFLQPTPSGWRHYQHRRHCMLGSLIRCYYYERNAPKAPAHTPDTWAFFVIGIFGWLPWRHIRNLLDRRGGWDWAALGGNCPALPRWGHRCLQARRKALCNRKHHQVRTLNTFVSLWFLVVIPVIHNIFRMLIYIFSPVLAVK